MEITLKNFAMKLKTNKLYNDCTYHLRQND